jgi:phenylacetic acid degradation operon negative regulatory protein
VMIHDRNNKRHLKGRLGMAQTQNLILRIVAQRGEIGSGELLEVAQKFGHSSDAIRAAANRMVRTGLLTKTGRGRGNLRYSVGPQGQALVELFIAKTVRWHMALESQLAWDGNWLVVTFSIPEGQRSKRDAFRSRLTEIGFGLLSSSVWISPFGQEADVTALVEELGLAGQVALLRCQRVWMPGVEGIGELACRVWGLEPVAAHYRDFNGRAEILLESLDQVGQGKEVDAEALFVGAMDLQQELLDIILAEDPCLPAELLPADWPSHRTHELFHAFTRTVDQLELAGSRYEYLFYLIQGMEVLEAFRAEGDDGLRWPSEGSGEP